MAGNETWNIGSSAAQFIEWIFSYPVPHGLTQQEHENVHAQHGYEYGGSSNHIDERNPMEHYNPGQHRYEYRGPSNHIDERNSMEHYNPGQRRYVYRGTTIHCDGMDSVEHYNPGRHVYGYGGSSNHTAARDYDVEHHNHNYGRHGFEHRGLSNHFDERDYEEYYDDEALATALMTMGVDHPHSSLDNTISNYPQFYDVGQVNEGLSKRDLSKLPTSKYKIKSKEKNQCVICYVEFKKGDKVITLPCKHFFHSECIIKWLEIKKHCPLCQREVKR